MNEITTRHIQQTIKLDSKKKIVVLPEVCRVYKDDFGSNVACLKFLLRFLEKKKWEQLSWLLEEYEKGGGADRIKVRFEQSPDFLSSLVKC